MEWVNKGGGGRGRGRSQGRSWEQSRALTAKDSSALSQVRGPNKHGTTDQPRWQQACPPKQGDVRNNNLEAGSTAGPITTAPSCNDLPVSRGHEILWQNGLLAKPAWRMPGLTHREQSQGVGLEGFELGSLETPVVATSCRVPLRVVKLTQRECHPRHSNR